MVRGTRRPARGNVPQLPVGARRRSRRLIMIPGRGKDRGESPPAWRTSGRYRLGASRPFPRPGISISRPQAGKIQKDSKGGAIGQVKQGDQFPISASAAPGTSPGPFTGDFQMFTERIMKAITTGRRRGTCSWCRRYVGPWSFRCEDPLSIPCRYVFSWRAFFRAAAWTIYERINKNARFPRV